MTNVQKPLSLLSKTLNKPVMVELKGNRGYRGTLDGFDQHMNVVLKNAEELEAGEVKRKVELAILRGDNVIFISP
jgi:small nuclear ribonucleoprotein